MISTNQFRNGTAIRVDGKRFTILFFQHVKPGKGGAFVRTRLRNIDSGAVVEKTFRAGEKLENVRTESRPMTYLYRDGDLLYFMDSDTYEQVPVPAEVVGEAAGYIVEGEAQDSAVDRAHAVHRPPDGDLGEHGVEPFLLPLNPAREPEGVRLEVPPVLLPTLDCRVQGAVVDVALVQIQERLFAGRPAAQESSLRPSSGTRWSGYPRGPGRQR